MKLYENTQYMEDWDVRKVKNLSSFFTNCHNLEEVNLSKWETPNLTDINRMFGMWDSQNEGYYDGKLKRIILSDKFDTSKVTDMSNMLINNTKIEDYSFLQYFDTSSVTNMTQMFGYNWNLKNLEPLRNWNVSNVNNYSRLFMECTNLEDASAIEDWDISPDADFTEMFVNTPCRNPRFTKVSGTWVQYGTFQPN